MTRTMTPLSDSSPAEPAPKKLRPLSKVVLGWNFLMLVWLGFSLGVISKTGDNCVVATYGDACRTGASLGGAIAIGGILMFTAVTDVILGVIWVVTKKD